MSDDLPTDERLRRIERGVQRRIDGRRQVAQRIAGASVAVVLVVGGFALVRPLLSITGTASSSTAGGDAQGTSAGDSTASEAAASGTVRCHDGATTRTVPVGAGDQPAAAIAACIAAARRAATAAQPEDRGPTPVPSPSAVVCESSTGVLHVSLGDAAACATHDLRPFRR